MKRFGKAVVIVNILLFLGGGARAQNSIDNSEFSIARIKWGSGNGWSFNPQWAHDWPSSEFNVMTKLKQVTSIDLTVNAGEIVGLAGLVGSGRSALLRTIAGLVRPSAGCVTLEGMNVTTMRPRDRAKSSTSPAISECLACSVSNSSTASRLTFEFRLMRAWIS